MTAREEAEMAVDWLDHATGSTTSERRIAYYQHALSCLTRARSAAKKELRYTIDNYTPAGPATEQGAGKEATDGP